MRFYLLPACIATTKMIAGQILMKAMALEYSSIPTV
jgi:hypothetical protein